MPSCDSAAHSGRSTRTHTHTRAHMAGRSPYLSTMPMAYRFVFRMICLVPGMLYVLRDLPLLSSLPFRLRVPRYEATQTMIYFGAVIAVRYQVRMITMRSAAREYRVAAVPCCSLRSESDTDLYRAPNTR